MNDSAKQYTSFWPVLIVFSFFTVMAIWNLYTNIQAKSHLEAGVTQLVKTAQYAQAEKEALNGMALDLVALAPSSLVAQQIVTDFRIQVKNPAPKQGAAPAPAPAANTNATPKQ